MNLKEKTAILLLGHGSRDPVAVKEFLDFARGFENKNNSNRSGKMEISSAFLELSEPSIPQALRQLAEKGIKKILAIPYFLFRAGHVKTEIPEMLDEFRKAHPGIEVIYGESLWPHKNLIVLASERINQSLRMFSGVPPEEVDVLVVGRGASDPEALEQFNEAVSELRSQISCRNLQHCFIALAEPKYTEALPEMFRNGTRHLIIFPFYLFTGILVKRIETQAKEAQQNFPEVKIKILPYYGDHPLMFEMLGDRVREAVISSQLSVISNQKRPLTEN